jgi:hexosaminidase
MDWQHLIPQPREITPSTGEWTATFPLAIALPPGYDNAMLDRVNAAATRLTGIAVLFRPVTSADENVRCIPGTPGELPSGAYRITVSSRVILVKFSTPESLPNALAVITQGILLDGADTSVRLPCADITDEPLFPWRGFMLDVARHFFPLAAVDRVIDYLWLMRINRFHLHLTDDQGWRIPVSDYPLLTETGAFRDDGTGEGKRYGGFYTTGELRQLDEDASVLGIAIVPEIDLPGHASAAITAYPGLVCNATASGVRTRWGIFDSVLCASRPGTYDFMEAVYAAVAETFSGPYIHIGGDEVPETMWKSCPDCSQLKNPYQAIVRAMANTVVRLDRRPVAWDEASALTLPESTIIVNWRRPDDAAEALKRGYDLVLAPEGRAAYLDHQHLDSPLEPGRIGVCTVADSAAFSPATYLSDRTGGNVIGGQANLWTEGVPFFRNVEYMAWVRLAAVADGLWRGSPAAGRPHFFDDLDRLRHSLIRRGINAYPGPFSDAGAGTAAP